VLPGKPSGDGGTTVTRDDELVVDLSFTVITGLRGGEGRNVEPSNQHGTGWKRSGIGSKTSSLLSTLLSRS